VHLIYDTERLDRYNRTLAHLFLLDGTNIQGKILRHGLAVPLTIPPNLLFSDCYQNISLLAQENKEGFGFFLIISQYLLKKSLQVTLVIESLTEK
jgi:endonuclease YncB( thermonuclease family)